MSKGKLFELDKTGHLKNRRVADLLFLALLLPLAIWLVLNLPKFMGGGK